MNRTAILFFSRNAEEELAFKKLKSDGSRLQNKAIVENLISNSLKVAKNSKLPVFCSNLKMQIGMNFGERFTNAIKEVFDSGYDTVITIGNDCPNLNSEKLQNTAKELQTNKIVVGPDARGGIYMLGIQKDSFNADQLAQLPWETNRLSASIDLWAKNANENIIWHNTLADINSAVDLESILKTASHLRIFQILASLMKSIGHSNRNSLNAIPLYYQSLLLPLRAPPSF